MPRSSHQGTPPPAPVPYLTPREAAAIAGVTEQTITGHCRGRYLPVLPAVRIAGRWMILPRDLEWWMQLERGPGRPPGSGARDPDPPA